MVRMSTWMAGLALVMALLGSVASTPAQNFAMVDGEKYFTIDWERGQYRGRPSVRGYIANRWGLAATNLRLKVEGLDGTGAVTSTTIDRVPGDVAPGSRGYFEILVPPAPNYRVSLSTYSMIESGGGSGGGGGGGGGM